MSQDVTDKKQDKQEDLDIFLDSFNTERKEWDDVVKKLSYRIKDDLKQSFFLESEAISRRVELNERIYYYTSLLSKFSLKLKEMRKIKFEYYVSKYEIKTNSSEKKMLMESDFRWVEIRIDHIQYMIEYLSETRKSVDHIIWSVKNKIGIYNILGLQE